MDTEALVKELESRGHAVVRCRVTGCGKPAVGSGLLCEDCVQEAERTALRKKYGCVSFCIPANESIMAERYRRTIEGHTPEEIETWLLETTGYDAETWDRIEQYVHAGRKYKAWVVWGKDEKRVFTSATYHMVVLARSGAEARKVWREYLYKRRCGDIPTRCFVKCVSGREDLGARVLSTDLEYEVESKLTTD